MRKNIKVYYTKQTESGRGLRCGDKPRIEHLIKDYALVYQGALEGRAATLEHLFIMFNGEMGYTNPLSDQGGQNMLKLLGVGHTSMSVGDIVEIDGVAYFCDSFGWATLNWGN